MLRKACALILLAALVLLLSSCADNEKTKTDTNTKDPVEQGERAPEIQIGEATRDIKVLDSKARYGATGYLHIDGKVQNARNSDVAFVKITANCKDSSGNNTATEYAYAKQDTIPAGGESPFEMMLSVKTKPVTCILSTATRDVEKSTVTIPSPPLPDTVPAPPQEAEKTPAAIAPSSPEMAGDDGTSSYSAPSGEPPVEPSVQTGLPVKMSKNGICHAPGTTFYNRTINYTRYNSLKECLAAGGREPER